MVLGLKNKIGCARAINELKDCILYIAKVFSFGQLAFYFLLHFLSNYQNIAKVLGLYLLFITLFSRAIIGSYYRNSCSRNGKSHQDKELWKIQVKTLKTPAKMANFQKISRILLASNFTEKMIFSHVFLSRIKIKDFN